MSESKTDLEIQLVRAARGGAASEDTVRVEAASRSIRMAAVATTAAVGRWIAKIAVPKGPRAADRRMLSKEAAQNSRSPVVRETSPKLTSKVADPGAPSNAA
jgi:hypothetical protein